MNMNLAETADSYSITFFGKLNYQDSFDIRKLMDSLDKEKSITINISAVHEMDSLGLGYLLAFHSEFEKPVVIICENKRLYEKLERVLLPRIMEVRTED